MERSNPWWRGESDLAHEAWEHLKVKWVPEEINQISLRAFSLNFLSGPRQVGKTTLIKLLVNRLLKAKNPKAILYVPCDEIVDAKELSEVVDTYLRARKAWGVKSSYIFLDEITFVHEWWRAVKARIDDGSLSNDVITVTGSSRLELLKQKEMFPGRRGFGKDVVLRPLGFRSYIKALSGTETKAAGDITHVAGAMDANSIFSSTLGERFLDFLSTGGFPLSIREMTERGSVGEHSKKSLLDGLRGDWLRAGRSESMMKEVLAYTIEAKGSPISWLSIAKATSIGSPHTARAYVEILENLMVVLSLNLVDPNNRVQYRKNKKLHLTDPFIYRTLSAYAGVDVDDAAVVEAIVASSLARKYGTFYWRDGSEADIIVMKGKKQWGVEVKWGFKKSRKPKHLQNYLALNKNTVPIFLASLGFT